MENVPLQCEVGIAFAAWLSGRSAVTELHRCGLMRGPLWKGKNASAG